MWVCSPNLYRIFSRASGLVMLRGTSTSSFWASSQRLDVMLLVPAAMEGQINEGNAKNVKAKLIGTGQFVAGDFTYFDATSATPTLANLQAATVNMIILNNPLFDRVTFGNNLAAYSNAGGRVVVTTFTDRAPPLGAWASSSYR